MKRAFVTGWPISHSKSPLLHGFWINQYGIEGSYEAVAVEPENFSNFFQEFENQGFCGGNVTIPHKEMAFDLGVRRDAAAEAIGAVNTLWLENGNVHAGNTDAYGFAANLDDLTPAWRDGERALVLGAGGAARAIVFSLLDAGFKSVNIANRTQQRAMDLASHFGENCVGYGWNKAGELVATADLIVNTTSIGMAGSEGLEFPDLQAASESTIVNDIIYNPLETPFLKLAADAGLTTADGLGMLLHQAVPGFEHWFGVRPEVTTELRQLILENL